MTTPSPLLRRWQQLPKRQQRLLLLLAVVSAVGFLDVAALRPLRLRLAQLQRDVREAERRLVEAMVASAQAESVAEVFEAYRSYLDQPVSQEQALATTLTEVEAAVRATGMILLNLKPGGRRGDGGQGVHISVEAEATPAQLVELLGRLHRSTQLLRVTELDVRVVEGRSLRASLVVSRLPPIDGAPTQAG